MSKLFHMKQILAILIIMSFTFIVKGQTIRKEQKVVQVMTPQTFYLNGGTRATFGGKSRTWFSIDLPANTVEWYYSYTSTKGQNLSSSIGLFSQLTRLVDPTGLSAVAATSILTPTGAGVCDIYLMDRDNADKFSRKVDNFSSDVSGSRENAKNGTVKITDIKSGSWCLGFKNPSATEGISITFEVAAIVEETKIIEKTDAEQKADVFGSLGWKSYEKGEYDKSMELSKKALELNPNLGWVHSNIGLVLLIKGDYISAINCYSSAITLFKKTDNPKHWFGESIKDLNDLITKHGQLEGANDILEMLKSEQKKY
jgi:tetratricopeptide (TPR) repeat protein